jgi:hypothetical protein
MQVPKSVVSPAGLADVSATGPADAWAVGAEAETDWRYGNPLILHWNGTAWSKVALRGVPGPGYLSSVSASSRSDAWVAGTDKNGAVLLHWNGRAWHAVSFPHQATAVGLDVAAAPHGIAWLVGEYKEAPGNFPYLLERWDGTAWHDVAGLGQGGLTQARVSPSGDLWALGLDGYGNNVVPLVAREHRGTWTALPQPVGIASMNDVLGRSPNDVWLVGTNGGRFPFLPAVVVHWNGTAWTTAYAPPATTVSTLGYLSISADNCGRPQWIGGMSGINPAATQYAYFNGTSWSIARGATRLSGLSENYDASTVVAHIPGTNATWGVGGLEFDGPVTANKAIIEYNRGTPLVACGTAGH